MGDITSSFPTSLSYRIRSLVGNMSRIGVKITPDRTTGIAPNDIVSLKLPNSSIVDLRTFNFFYQFTTSGTTGTFLHPRYASSLIERISIIINGNTIDILPSYNFLYNTLMDLEGSSFDQFSKRNVCEWFDPSLKFTSADPTSTTDVALVSDNWTKSGATAPSKADGAVTHWLGFLGSCVPSCLDTSDLGDVFICISQIKRQSNFHNVSYQEELIRMMAHGILHLCGFDHQTESDEKVMFDFQEKIVAEFL